MLRGRYEFVLIANDILVGLWFLAGSILFLYPTTAPVAIWFFAIGNVERLIGPETRMVRRTHLQKCHAAIPVPAWTFETGPESPQLLRSSRHHRPMGRPGSGLPMPAGRPRGA